MIRFYYLSGSPYSWRVQLALEEKGLPYDPVLLSARDGDLRSPEHLARSPHGKVPALSDGDASFYESTVILEYLEERYPAPALMPADPAARALVRTEELECVEYLPFFPLARQAFFTAPEKRDAAALDAARTAVRDVFDALEARASGRPGAFIAGTAPTRADYTWIPFVEICARAGVELDRARQPWLVTWRDAMRKRPSYERSYPPHWRD